MSDSTKKLLIAFGAVAVLCVCAIGAVVLVFAQFTAKVSEALDADPTQVAAVADRIAEYDLPPGYREAMGISLFNSDMIYIMPENLNESDMMIMMMQATQGGNADPADIQRAMQQQTGRQATSTRVIENRSETIRGEPVTITISESTAQGYTFMQWVTAFRGNHGPTILMIQGSQTSWDEDLALDFIHSIR